ncbi:EAL domain-containing protein [Marinomonas ostreistagni]|uniref:EAL domain-containing protein n=1 Tax=Marinomonas ostreistagni TaxID=359209 RepID=A0ABS0ZAB9_9GAMM|nr:EAL domain-containing protein [Marinomonas ostreistagni]MBJ7549906.1 EAL domain-containing protein [Marinomonas ostreistagni]
MTALPRWMHIRLSVRFILITLILLIFIQTIGFWIVQTAVERYVRDDIQHSIAVSERVWNKLIIQNHQQLVEGAELLASDFGFRSAVASKDENTISSALANSAQRIGASVAILVDQQWHLKATSKDDMMKSSKLVSLIDELAATRQEKGEEAYITALYSGAPTQFVVVPVKAPRLVGYVIMGFAIERDMVAEASDLSGIDVVLMSNNGASSVKVMASSDRLEEHFLQDIPGRFFLEDLAFDMRVAQETFVSVIHGQEVIGGFLSLAFMKSLEEAGTQFDELFHQYLVITLIGLVIFAVAVTWLSRRVTRPLERLTDATGALQEGNYDVEVSGVGRMDEVGALARSFDGMRSSIKDQRETIFKLAYNDALTGLPNRLSFRQKVADLIESGEVSSLSVITINLDRFKQVNDVLGYEMGDEILKATATRLLGEACSAQDKLARVSGDEFSVLVLPSEDTPMKIAQSLLARLNEPMEIDHNLIDLSASIGIASWPIDAQQCDALINASQVAMYAAKRRSEDIISYKSEFVTSTPESLSLLSELRQAVTNNELRVYLQPKVSTVDHRVIAAEALVRWQHPEKGLVPPFKFVPFAEQTGFIRELTKWMIRSLASQWQGLQLGHEVFRVSVNLSTRDLLSPTFPDFVQQTLHDFQVPTTGVCLEITESAIMDDPTFAEQTLAKLSNMGFRLSIDDFGTGYSSLGYLKRLPVNELKVDQSFVFGMIEDNNDRTIVQSTIDLAHNLGLEVVAEGVETEAMYLALRELGCEEAQGYFIGKPMPVEEFIVWRDQWHKEHGLA